MKVRNLGIDIVSNPLLKQLIDLAVQEDLGAAGDITTKAVIKEPSFCRASILAKSVGILAGTPICRAVFNAIDSRVKLHSLMKDGDTFVEGDSLLEISGPTVSILAGERIALNFMQHLSGIATLTRRYVEIVKGTGALIYDTRKTLPGLRAAEKYAVLIGGGCNHRFGLYDAVLIKDNHLSVSSGIAGAVSAAKKEGIVEVEVENLGQLDEALQAGADIILLDNMDVNAIRAAVERAGGRAILEASGGITLDNVKSIAETGVDRISIGALTHSAPPADIALEILCAGREPG